MAQGRALSVLTRAWQCTAAAKYSESARRALAAFSVPIERGGITDTYDGRITYEEYPARPAPHVLNGMIFALFGVWDVVRAQPDEGHAAEIFERGAATVEALLPRYDTGWWSLCDLYHLEAATPRNPCTAHYTTSTSSSSGSCTRSPDAMPSTRLLAAGPPFRKG